MTFRERLAGWKRRYSLPATLLVLGFLLFVAYFFHDIFISIYPGQAGVLWKRVTGTVTRRVYGEGLHIIAPWNKMYIYNIRLQESEGKYDVLSSDGLKFEVVISLRYRPIRERLAELHQHIGPNYLKSFILPEIGAHAREEIARFRPEELYTSKRREITEAIIAKTQERLQVSYHPEGPLSSPIYFEDVFLKSVTLPPVVAAAIESKLAQEQLMLEYDYRLEREEKEKARKRIEAEGIRLFQDIVAEGISDRYLKWKGIDATLELAKSPNAKIVVIGSGEDGLPLILGPLDAAGGTAAATTPPP